eukprot:gene6933-8270_t
MLSVQEHSSLSRVKTATIDKKSAAPKLRSRPKTVDIGLAAAGTERDGPSNELAAALRLRRQKNEEVTSDMQANLDVSRQQQTSSDRERPEQGRTHSHLNIVESSAPSRLPDDDELAGREQIHESSHLKIVSNEAATPKIPIAAVDSALEADRVVDSSPSADVAHELRVHCTRSAPESKLQSGVDASTIIVNDTDDQGKEDIRRQLDIAAQLLDESMSESMSEEAHSGVAAPDDEANGELGIAQLDDAAKLVSDAFECATLSETAPPLSPDLRSPEQEAYGPAASTICVLDEEIVPHLDGAEPPLTEVADMSAAQPPSRDTVAAGDVAAVEAESVEQSSSASKVMQPIVDASIDSCYDGAIDAMTHDEFTRQLDIASQQLAESMIMEATAECAAADSTDDKVSEPELDAAQPSPDVTAQLCSDIFSSEASSDTDTARRLGGTNEHMESGPDLLTERAGKNLMTSAPLVSNTDDPAALPPAEDDNLFGRSATNHDDEALAQSLPAARTDKRGAQPPSLPVSSAPRATREASSTASRAEVCDDGPSDELAARLRRQLAKAEAPADAPAAPIPSSSPSSTAQYQQMPTAADGADNDSSDALGSASTGGRCTSRPADTAALHHTARVLTRPHPLNPGASSQSSAANHRQLPGMFSKSNHGQSPAASQCYKSPDTALEAAPQRKPWSRASSTNLWDKPNDELESRLLHRKAQNAEASVDEVAMDQKNRRRPAADAQQRAGGQNTLPQTDTHWITQPPLKHRVHSGEQTLDANVDISTHTDDAAGTLAPAKHIDAVLETGILSSPRLRRRSKSHESIPSMTKESAVSELMINSRGGIVRRHQPRTPTHRVDDDRVTSAGADDTAHPCANHVAAVTRMYNPPATTAEAPKKKPESSRAAAGRSAGVPGSTTTSVPQSVRSTTLHRNSDEKPTSRYYDEARVDAKMSACLDRHLAKLDAQASAEVQPAAQPAALTTSSRIAAFEQSASTAAESRRPKTTGRQDANLRTKGVSGENTDQTMHPALARPAVMANTESSHGEWRRQAGTVDAILSSAKEGTVKLSGRTVELESAETSVLIAAPPRPEACMHVNFVEVAQLGRASDAESILSPVSPLQPLQATSSKGPEAAPSFAEGDVQGETVAARGRRVQIFGALRRMMIEASMVAIVANILLGPKE